ncbi:alpha-crystallin A chain [Bombyx mori]|uniref:SHSP domain-containing protein n=1 Tax=Bombyx mori TaxID=7091 RepID=A0A8R1WFX5_BOMMO|nr:alpha-crystallin A chain [Bombyx mori]
MSSLLPYLIDVERSRIFEEPQLTVALLPQELLSLLRPEISRSQFSWRQPGLREGSSIKKDKSKFQINLDIQHFSPDDITVKIVDGFVVVEALHEEKQDQHGWVSRRFTRRCPIPEGCDTDAVESRLSSDGVLTVSMPLQRRISNERRVPIIQTGPVKISDEPKPECVDSIETPPANGE